MAQKSFRDRRLAQIHIAKKDLGMSEEAYRDMLKNIGGVDSAANLSPTSAAKVLEHLGRLGWQPRATGKSNKPQPKRYTKPADSRAQQSKIVALITSMGVSDAYVDAIAMRIAGVQRWQWADADGLRGIITALNVEARKRAAGRRGGTHV